MRHILPNRAGAPARSPDVTEGRRSPREDGAYVCHVGRGEMRWRGAGCRADCTFGRMCTAPREDDWEGVSACCRVTALRPLTPLRRSINPVITEIVVSIRRRL